MTDEAPRPLIPDARDVEFSEAEKALRLADGGGSAPARALTGTLVAIGPRRRLGACSAFVAVAEATGQRAVLIATDPDLQPRTGLRGLSVSIEGLKPAYVNNAVAALRLSSLPTLIWWRGGDPSELDRLASLADRLVLDAEDPYPAWARVPALAERVAISDARWAALTRWRALMAHFLDVPEVVAVAPSLHQLQLTGSDRPAMRLFAGWIAAALRFGRALSISLDEEPGAPVLHSVSFGDGAAQELSLRLRPNTRCVEAAARVRGHAGATRTVPLGEQGPAALLAEELRIRARDRSFEAALQALAATD